MLKRATCIAHTRSPSWAPRPLTRSAQQHAPLIERYRRLGFQTISTHFERPLSTQVDGAKEAQDAKARSETDEDGPKPQPQPQPQPQLQLEDPQSAQGGDEVIDDSTQSFVLTPRFQWRWRWTYPSEHRKEKTAGKSDARSGRARSSKNELNMETPSTDHFLPNRSEEERNQLQSVMDSLVKLSDELQPPPSPLEKELEDKDWRLKRRPTKQERQTLAYNPWAMMLAGHMRFDAGSRLRLPEPLLLPLGQVTKPGGDSIYLLPDDLANLEAYDEQLRKGLRRVAMLDLHRGTGGTTVNLSPYKPLIDELTDEMVVWDGKLKTGRTKNGQIAKRLLPTPWMERAQRVKAYQNASKDYWNLKERLGETDEQDFKRPEAPVDVSQIQWQPNVAERMQSVMRQRLLLSIDQLGRKVNEPRSQPRNHTMRFKWPESLILNVFAKSKDTTNDTGANYIGAQQYMSEPHTAATPDAATPPTWTPTLTASHFLDPGIWLPGSCFLHIGPPETALTALSPSQQPTTPGPGQNPAYPSICKFTPPMLKVNNHLRLPVFNVPALLGPKFDHPLHQVLTRHGMGSPLPTSSDNPSNTNTNTNYLILIRATAPGYHYVVRELWQLWRFLGGTDCLNPDVLERFAPYSRRTEVQKQKDRLKEYAMPKRVWDHLYSFLPGVERTPGLGRGPVPVSLDQEGKKEDTDEVGES